MRVRLRLTPPGHLSYLLAHFFEGDTRTMQIKTVGVLGAGQMGLGIAQAAGRAGFDTIMAKATPGSLDAQKGKIEKQLQKDVEKGKLAAADLGALLERLKWTTHLHDLASVDLLIESIVEELPVKRDHF